MCVGVGDVSVVVIDRGIMPFVGGGRCGVLQGTNEVEGYFHHAWVVACDHHSEYILKAYDEEGNLVLFTGDAGMQSIGDEGVDVVVHSANMLGRCKVFGGVPVRPKLLMRLSMKNAHSVMGASFVVRMYHQCAATVR